MARTALALVLVLLAAPASHAWLTWANYPQPSFRSGRWTPPQTLVCDIGNGMPTHYRYNATNEAASLAGGAGALLDAATATWNADRGSEVQFGPRKRGDYAAGSIVAAGDDDAGLPLSVFHGGETYFDANGDTTYSPGEPIYNSGPNVVVTVGDVRLTSVVAGGRDWAAGTTVQAGDADLGRALRGFVSPVRHEDVDADGVYDPGERVFDDRDNDDVSSAGDARLFGPCRCTGLGALGDGVSCVGWPTPAEWAAQGWAGNTWAITFVHGPAAGRLDEFDICINPAPRSVVVPGAVWGVGAPNLDFQSVLLHEFGHALGLAHPNNLGAVDSPRPPFNGQRPDADYEPQVVMYSVIPVGTVKRRLSCDDRSGANFLCPPLDVITERRTYVEGISGGCDFGDAPDAPYPSLEVPLGRNGARHKDGRMEWLGPIGLAASEPGPVPAASEQAPVYEAKTPVLPSPPNGFLNPFPGSVVIGQDDPALPIDADVVAGDRDVGEPTIPFNGDERHADPNNNSRLDFGEGVYRLAAGQPATGFVKPGDVRLTAVVIGTRVTYAAGTVVRAGDEDVRLRTPLYPFQSGVRHADPDHDGVYDDGEGIYESGINTVVTVGDRRLRAPGAARPASATFEVAPRLTGNDELDDGMSLRRPILPPILGVPQRVLVDVLVDTTATPGRYQDDSLYVNGWEDWNGDGDWTDWTNDDPAAGPPPCTPAPPGAEWVLHWQGDMTNDQTYSRSFCGSKPIGTPPYAKLLTFVMAAPPLGGPGPQPPGLLTLSPFWERLRLDYGENVGQVLRAFSEPGSLVISPTQPVTFADRNLGIGFAQGEAKYGEVEDYPYCVLWARTRAVLNTGASMLAGMLAVNDANGLLKVGRAAIAQPDSWLIAARVVLGKGADVGSIATPALSRASGSTIRGTVTTVPAPPLLSPFPAPPVVVPGTSAVLVAPATSVALAPGAYGYVRVRTAGTLLLTAGEYRFASLILENRARVIATGGGAVTLSIAGVVRLGAAARLGAEAGTPSPIVSSAGTLVSLSQNAILEATLFAPAATLKVGRNALAIGGGVVTALGGDHSGSCACVLPPPLAPLAP